MTQKRINKTTNLIKVGESLLIYESPKWILRAIALSMKNPPLRHCEAIQRITEAIHIKQTKDFYA